MTDPAKEVLDLKSRYRELALRWEAARDSPDLANRVFRDHHALYKSLRDSEAGRETITGLLGDTAVVVQLLAATHSLAWEARRAEQVLETVAEGDSPYAVDAKWTLRSYLEGSLNLAW